MNAKQKLELIDAMIESLEREINKGVYPMRYYSLITAIAKLNNIAMMIIYA